MAHPARSHDSSLAAELQRTTGLNVATCYQCGKCTAGCPMAQEMPLKPHQMLRLAQLDQREKLLADSSLWLCLTCETCTSRCPNEVDPARLIDGLRELAFQTDSPTLRDALREKNDPGRARIRAFHEAFLDQIRKYGRLYEVGLTLEYKLRSGALLSDLLTAPGMISRGKLAFVPSRISGRDEVRRIFQACQPATAAAPAEEAPQ